MPGFAKRAGFSIVGEYYDAAVSGADAIEDRPGFTGLLDRIESNGVRTVIVEDTSRFAREMRAHVLGIALLRERGVRLLSAVDGQNLTEDTDEMTEGMVTIMAVFAQIEKKRLVKKLAAARKRKRERDGKCEGRKSHREARPEVVALARKLRRKRPKGSQMSLRGVSKELAAAGYLNERGRPYAAKSVASMLN
jgi:DNA invertase Pin-like site-specific DNA recombinase